MRNAKLVEDAAVFASAMAADRVAYPWTPWVDVAKALNTPLRARDLAWAAYDATPIYTFHESWAFACSLLRNREIPVGAEEEG